MENEEEKKPAEVKKKEERDTFLQRAEDLVTRNEKAVEEMRKLVERNEELAARNLLGGKSDAGIQPSIPIEDSPKEYARKVLTGEIKPTK